MMASSFNHILEVVRLEINLSSALGHGFIDCIKAHKGLNPGYLSILLQLQEGGEGLLLAANGG